MFEVRITCDSCGKEDFVKFEGKELDIIKEEVSHQYSYIEKNINGEPIEYNLNVILCETCQHKINKELEDLDRCYRRERKRVITDYFKDFMKRAAQKTYGEVE